MQQKRPFLTRKGDGGFNPTQAQASKGDDGFRQPAHLADRARLRHPRAAGPGCDPLGGDDTTARKFRMQFDWVKFQ